jgi:g-D-glutamyl-meso-diaminopimelate peptidase
MNGKDGGRLVTRILAGCLLIVLLLTAALVLLSIEENKKAANTPEPVLNGAPASPCAPTEGPTAVPIPASAEPEKEKDFTRAGLSPDSVVDPYDTYSYARMLEDLETLEERYPELIRCWEAGTSAEGRRIPGFDLGRGDRKIVLISTMHASEHIATNMLMYLVDQYCQGYVRDGSYGGQSYRELLDGVTFRVIPMANPDGVELAQGGLAAVRDPQALIGMGYGPDTDFSSWQANIRGVDLNANFAHKWGIRDDVSGPGFQGWCGPEPLSEPESRAMQELLDGTDYEMLISLHIRGEAIFWLDSDTWDLYDAHFPIARRISDAIGCGLMGAEDVSRRGGYLVNTARITTRRFCATVELCPYIPEDPYPVSEFPEAVDNIYPLLLALGREVLSPPED